MLETTREVIATAAIEVDGIQQNHLKDSKQQVSFLRWINPFLSNVPAVRNEERLNEAIPDEYKGVQSLKQFWNNRICAIKDTKQKSATLGGFHPKSISVESNLSSSRSISCLISSQSDQESDGLKKSKEAEDHSQIDNFYKYRTAATKKRSSLGAASDLAASRSSEPQNEQKIKAQKISSFGANFPLVAATETGEKIHWARREDIFVNRKQKQNSIETVRLKSETPQSESPLDCTIVIGFDKEKLFDNSPGSTGAEMAIKSSVTTTTTSTTRNSDKTDSSRSHNGSTNSLSSDSPARKRIATPRKYSFKTHAKNYYAPRKMATNVGGNKVAALTNQFNQMIQKDAALLKEVKKKNGILMTRAGHVYKIKQESEVVRRRTNKRNGSDDDTSVKSGKKRSSIKKQSLATKVSENVSGNKDVGTVKAKIWKFETQDKKSVIVAPTSPLPIVKLQKPEVPSKSEQVLQRTKEIAIRNSLKRIKSPTLQTTPEVPKVLEEIKEETKITSDLHSFKEEITNEAEENKDQEDVSAQSNDFANEALTPEDEEEKKTEIEVPDSVLRINFGVEFEESQKKKRKYSRLYEKFLFKSPFKKALNDEKSCIEYAIAQQDERKILEALETVNKKLDHLSKSTNDVRMKEENDCTYEGMASKMKPNESFLFRRNSKNALTPTEEYGPTKLVEAVNTRLINKTQSMDEIRLPSLQIRQISLEEREYPNIVKQTDELLNRLREQQKEEEDIYEPIGVHSQPELVENSTQSSFIFKCRSISKEEAERKVPEVEECIYQTVVEAKDNHRNSISSYESYDNYESVPEEFIPKVQSLNREAEDGYEVCDPPEPPPPRKSDPDIRSSTDGLPPLPSPKRIIPPSNFLKLDSGKVAPPRLPKSPNTSRPELPEIPHEPPDDTLHCHEDQNYEGENIYDTIKSSESASHCYEVLNNKNLKSLDSVSVISNCYESINSLRRAPVLRHSDSVSTLSSEQKTNSLYGMTLGQNSSPPNEVCSDNSDEWIDISDGEEETGSKHHFIVVRERTKCHRSPVWSKKVRDQRIHQQVVDYDYDSDHYYEPLFVLGQNDLNASTPSKAQTARVLDPSRRQLSPLIMPDNSYLHTTGENCYSDDYDSFDTDEDTDEDVKKHDSGVDISNAKLPDPPPSTNQVYAFVKKFKNFISIRKPSSSSSPKTPDYQGKPYENTPFYVGNENEYQNVSFVHSKPQKSTKVKTPKVSKKTSKQSLVSDDPYENTEFHTPRTPVATSNASSSPYIMPIINHPGKPESVSPLDSASRKKSKAGKSFKSKLRKSLASPDSGMNIGSTLNAPRSTFYISDSVDMDSGIFEKNPQSDTNLSQSSVNETPLQEKSATVARKNKKTHSPDLNRRKTTIGIRPNNPPPPPPVDKKSQKKRTSTTSWYAECGVFKANNINDDLLLKDAKKDRGSNTSWYAEAGLYQTSGASVASSSGSSGVSTGGEGGPGDENSHSMFSNEPLYQIYSAAKLESISHDMEDQESTDGYEEIGTLNKTENRRKSARPSALQLVGPKQGPSRTLWSEIPEVINSEILPTLTPTERRLQEAKFEILTSEASYLKSLNLLRTHFMSHPAFRDASVLSSSDRKILFSHIVPVHECSDRLLSDLENCWQDNIMLLGLSKSLYKHADKYFHVYIKFCEHQGKMDRTLRRLKEAKGVFNQTLENLETDPVCCGLNLHSFLMLPMQRITRLPLLIDAVFSKLKPDDDEYEDWKMTLAILNKIVGQCNEAANRCEQAYEIERISRQIEFPSNIRSIAIAPAGVPAPGIKPRNLVKKGELMHLIWRGDDAKLTFGKKFAKCNIYVFLFTDLLVLTKRKGEEQFLVFDYCTRSMLTVSSGEVVPQLPTKEITQAGKNLILMTLLENYEGKTIEMLLSCPSISEQQRWLQATAPPEPENPGEKLYEQWDCPQVIAKHDFYATEPDLLSLEPGDVVNVSRKMTDGWYQGERIRDGATGWFPGNYTEEVNSPHVRARNLKQRYRLLTLTASYLESQKRKI